MNIDEQLQILIDNTSEYGIVPVVMEQAIAPVLKLFAQQLKYQDYFILQNLDQNWLLTTISHPQQPDLVKKVIYAFSTVKDAAKFQGAADPSIYAAPLPITHILFQLLAIPELNSMIFLENPGNLTTGTEIVCDRLHELIQEQLKQLDNIPPDIA
jgi:non-ribosomal peptide synthetase component E (peptide arylation enzyme)